MTPIAPHLTAFFRERLPLQRDASPHTCESYAYSFQLLLEFASDRLNVTPSKLYLEQLDAALVMEFCLARAEAVLVVDAMTGIRATEGELLSFYDEYAEEPLNRICPEYGSANRVFAAAWAEQHARSEWIVALDSDTVFAVKP